MIKNFMFALWGSLFFISTVQAQQITTKPESEEHLLNDKIYFFAHSMCYSCKDAYLYFEQAHPELNIGITDMKYSHNLALYKECVNKFAIKNQELTLPLICMGNTYIMGWNKTSPAQFEQNLKSFQK